jgi:TolB-like protein
VSLYAELKRRGVLKVGGAYVVVAWVIVQVASIAFPAFEAPAWVLRVFILVAMLGFPIAVVMAWVLEVTPDGVRHEPSHLGNKRVFGISAALVLLALAWYFVGQPALRREEATRLAAAGAPPPAPVDPAPAPKSIAVLPFVNMSADKDNEYFSDGISEELLNALVRVEGLGVASRTSSFAYKGSPLGAAAIAKELKVAHILEGSVRKSGTQVRITAQLIDTGNDRHVWSQTYDRELTDIFAIQDEIAKAIVAALQVKLDAAGASAVAVKADTGNMQAYDLYLKARELFIARRELPEVVRLYERAIELDPKFARAYEGLAAAAVVIRSWGYDDRDYDALVEPAAARALELDPTLSMPWAARSMARKRQWPVDFAAAIADLDKAIAADPRNATAVFWRGIAWIDLGFFDRAIVDLDRCLALEPGYHNCRSHKAIALLFKGEEDAAFALFERTVRDGAYISRNDHFVAPLWRHGQRTAAMLLLDANDIQPALRAAVVASLEHPGTANPDAKALVADHLANARSAEAKSVVGSRIFHWLGDFDGVAATDDIVIDQILAWERDPPAWRNSPQMKGKLVRMGAVDYWRQHGFPPQCRAVGQDDFTCD